MADNQQKSASFSWADINKLFTSLQDGELSLATALGQFGAVVRDGLKIIETFAGEQMKLNLDRKLKLEKTDKLVRDLTEKCQCMQQALLYKEEKYDEKCREVERYKVICELSAKSAVNDELYYTSMNENNNDVNNNTFDTTMREPLEPHVDKSDRMSAISAPSSRGTSKKIKVHTKITSGRPSQKSRIPAALSSHQAQPTSGVSRDKSHRAKLDEAYDMAAYYVGGPTRRPRKHSMVDDANKRAKDAQLRDGFSIIGGVNVDQSSMPGPVRLDRIFRPENFDIDDQKTSNKIALVGQRNEVISSSRNAVNMMRQKLFEKDLHKQVAEGSSNRLASRRKKEWPF